MWFKQIQGHWHSELTTAEQVWTLTPSLIAGGPSTEVERKGGGRLIFRPMGRRPL